MREQVCAPAIRAASRAHSADRRERYEQVSERHDWEACSKSCEERSRSEQASETDVARKRDLVASRVASSASTCVARCD